MFRTSFTCLVSFPSTKSTKPNPQMEPITSSLSIYHDHTRRNFCSIVTNFTILSDHCCCWYRTCYECLNSVCREDIVQETVCECTDGRSCQKADLVQMHETSWDHNLRVDGGDEAREE